MAEAAFAALPPGFRDRCQSVALRVAEFADRETLADLGIESPWELTGLYRGVALTQKSHEDSGGLPDEVWLYRQPILLEWIETPELGLEALISHVLVHEIGHHFGLSDADIDAIESRATG
ncbi:MAG: metallopeptidase family protein [Pseudomonadota bacterium]